MAKAPQLTELDHKKLELQRVRAQLADKLAKCYVSTDLNSKAVGTVAEMQRDTVNRGHWVIAPNGVGKTAYGSREIAWWFLGSHPYKKRLPEWGDQPLFIIISSKTTAIIQQEIWTNKLKPLLPAGSYVIEKEDKECIRLIVNPLNGNRIMFTPHNDAKNARERIQALTCHIAWVDEMPDHSSYLSEILMRLRAGTSLDKEAPLAGYFYGTFTPLIEDEGVKQLVESAVFPFKKYQLKMEDNPFYAGWTTEELDSYVRARCQDEVEFRARRYGEWFYSSERVFGGYDPTRNRRALPFPYSPSLQHAIIVDPAASGKVGISVAVLQPAPSTPDASGVSMDVWWIIESEKLEGAAASLLVKDIESKFVEKPKRFISEDGRICDCAPSGFYKEAHVQKFNYRPYREKNDKKKETIEATNRAFFNCSLMLLDSPATEPLHLELLTAKWKANESEIQNSHKYHCADTVRYLWMKRPKRVKKEENYASYMQMIKQEAKKEDVARELAAEKQKNRMPIGRSPLSRRRMYGR